MTVHQIRHRLAEIAKFGTTKLRECGYARDYEEAMRSMVINIVQLGDDLDKESDDS